MNNNERGSKIQPFMEKEFLKCLGIIIAAAGFNCRGCELWAKDNKETWPTIMRSPDFGQYLGENRFKEFWKLIPCIWENPSARDSDPWWEFSAAVQEFNKQWQDLIRASNWKVEDESMSAWCPRKTKTGGLPNISYVMRKPEPLGNFFVCLCVCVLLFYNLFLTYLLFSFRHRDQKHCLLQNWLHLSFGAAMW